MRALLLAASGLVPAILQVACGGETASGLAQDAATDQSVQPDAGGVDASEDGNEDALADAGDASGDGSPSVDGGYGGATVLAGGQPGPIDVSVDDDFVYWLNAKSEELMRAPIDGGVPEQLATPFFDGGASQSGAIVSTPTYVYWAAEGLIQLVKATGTKNLVAAAYPGMTDVVVGADGVYFSALDAIGRVSHDGKGPETLVIPSSGPRRLAASGNAIYWTDDAAVRRWQAPNLVEVLFAGEVVPWAIVVDGADLFWTAGGSGTCDGALRGATIGGPATTVWAPTCTSTCRSPRDLVQDGDGLILGFEEAGCPITRLDKNGTLLGTIPGYAGQTRGLVATDKAIYWADLESGSVFVSHAVKQQ